MVMAIVSHPKSVFDVLAYKNSPTPPMYYGTAPPAYLLGPPKPAKRKGEGEVEPNEEEQC